MFFEWKMQHYPYDTNMKVLERNNVILQDNTSAKKFERYRKRYIAKRTRKININYFYVTSKINDRTVTAITYCIFTDQEDGC